MDKVLGLFATGVAVVFLSYILVTWLFVDLGKNAITEIEGTETKMEEYITKRVVIESDTLTVVDYSILNDNYILSDGTSVSSIFMERCESF